MTREELDLWTEGWHTRFVTSNTTSQSALFDLLGNSEFRGVHVVFGREVKVLPKEAKRVQVRLKYQGWHAWIEPSTLRHGETQLPMQMSASAGALVMAKCHLDFCPTSSQLPVVCYSVYLVSGETLAQQENEFTLQTITQDALSRGCPFILG